MLALLALLVSCLLAVHAADQPTHLWLHNLTKINEQKDILEVSIRFNNDAPLPTVSGEIRQAVAFDNDWRVKVSVLHAAAPGDDYRKVLSLSEQGVCDVMASYYKQFFYDTLKDHANAPDPDVCPVSAANYTIKDYPLHADWYKLFKTGYYRVMIAVLLAEEEKFSYMLLAQLA